MKKNIFAIILAGLLAAAPLVSLAAPSPSPDSSTSTVTSPDGTTRTVTSDGETAASAAPSSTKSSENDDGDSEDEQTSDDTESDTDSKSSSDGSSDNTVPARTTPLEEGVTMEDPYLDPPNVQYAQAALIMDMASGRVLYSKNLDERMYPASTTKIMTCILALENGNMEDTVTATYEALKSITLEDSHMGILIGEELTMEQLVKGMMVHSANDAANVIAVHVGGSLEAFTDMMNQKAQELGMTGTHFANTCGTHDENHYTTTRDLAILAKYAMKNEQFREIVKMPIYKIPATNKYMAERILVNTNLFLGTSRSTYHYYPPAIGIKTGHTSQSGYCLVSAAKYNDMEYLAIVMNCPDADTREQAYSYIDSRALFDFGFDNYTHKTIANVGDIVADSKVYEAKNDMRVAVTVENSVDALISSKEGAEENIKTTVNLPEQLAAPVNKGDNLGTITYTYNGVPLGEANLIATNDVERNNVLHIFHLIMRVVSSPFFFIPVIILIIILFIARRYKKKKERQKRIQQIRKNRQQNPTNTRTPDRNASRTERSQRETKSENSRYRRRR